MAFLDMIRPCGTEASLRSTMVVSDLHGDKDAFARHVGRFLQLHSRKRVQRILFLGDLIHSDGPESDDASLQIVNDIMRMRATLGPDARQLSGR